MKILINELINEARRVTAAGNNIEKVSGYLIRCITDSSGIPFRSEDAEKKWQIAQVRGSLPNITEKQAIELVELHSPKYS